MHARSYALVLWGENLVVVVVVSWCATYTATVGLWLFRHAGLPYCTPGGRLSDPGSAVARAC